MDYTSNKILNASIQEIFGVNQSAELDKILQVVEIVEIQGGQYLIRRGEEADSMYIVISGRLLAMVPDAIGKQKIVGDIGRGESVGEMTMINDGMTRSADIFSIRDSVLAKINKEDFTTIISEFPSFLLNISKLVVTRLQNQLSFQKRPNNFIAFSIFKLDVDEVVNNFVSRFLAQIGGFGTPKLVNAAYVDEELGQEGISKSQELADVHHVSVLLNELESQHDYLLLVADQEDNAWSQRCLRQSDYSLLIGNVQKGVEKRSIDAMFDNFIPENGWNVKLVLIHPEDTVLPKGTKRWYENRRINGHFHVRTNHGADIRRLVRLVCGKSNGLVLSGGGAKGLAHVGIYKALAEKDIHLDYVCGTSIGSIMAAFIGMDMNPKELDELAAKLFLGNPTPWQDINLFPFYSLLNGKKMDRMLQEIFGGHQIEDLWIPYFCVSSDLTTFEMRLHESGELWKSIRSSISLPGVFPPVVYDGHILVDGVVFNNIPVDIMINKGVGNIIGVNLDTEEIKKVNVEELPGFFQRWSAKLFGRNQFENLPGMMETIAKSTFAMSENHSRNYFKSIDLFFNPPVSHFGLMDWKAYHDISGIGYKYATDLLDERDDLDRFRD